MAVIKRSRLILKKPVPAVTAQALRQALPLRPVPSVMERVKSCTPSSPFSVLYRMCRHVLTVMVPDRLSRKSVLTVMVQVIKQCARNSRYPFRQALTTASACVWQGAASPALAAVSAVICWWRQLFPSIPYSSARIPVFIPRCPYPLPGQPWEALSA